MSNVNILVVEDNLADAHLVKAALRLNQFDGRAYYVRNGVEATAFLRRESPWQDAPRPHLILLDLNMPRMDGRETLAAIKSDAALATIPVIVLTNSDAEADVLGCYANHANCYLNKPVDFHEFNHLIGQTLQFWLGCAKLPAL